MAFISLPYPTVLAGIFSTILNRIDKSRYSCIVLDFRGKFSVLTLNMMFAVDFFIDAFYQMEEVPFYS